MKRLTILAVIAMVTVATSSGCRMCGLPFGLFNRGGCCGIESSDAYASSYGPGVIYEGDTMLPPPNELLPGPRAATQ